MGESEEWKYIKERTDLFAENKYQNELIQSLQRVGKQLEKEREQLVIDNFKLTLKIERYEKVLKEIAADERNCEWHSELGEIDPYDGYEKTMKAKGALQEN